MSQVRIKLLSERFWREKPAFDSDAQLEYARYMLPHGFLTLPRMESTKEGEAAAEEMFDLTNNPSRQLERLMRYGNGRSVSSGDIIEVDGVDYLCCSIGWVVVEKGQPTDLKLITNFDGHDI